MSNIKGRLGDSWSIQIVPFITLCLYLGIAVFNPSLKVKSIAASLHEIKILMIPLVSAIFIGGVVKNLLSPEIVSRYFIGNKNRSKGVVGSVVVGAILPPCPFIACPIIRAFRDKVLSFFSLITMLVSSTMVEVVQVFCGLAVLGFYIVGVRMLFAFTGVMIICFFYYYVYYYIFQKRSRNGSDVFKGV